MITRRDLVVATASIFVTCLVISLAHAQNTLIGAAVYDWNKLSANKTDVSEYRLVMRAGKNYLSDQIVGAQFIAPIWLMGSMNQTPTTDLGN